jgi:hypothetical protein
MSKAKFTLGKIVSKYLIVDVLSHTSENTLEICTYLYNSCRKLRQLLIENMHLIPDLINYVATFNFSEPIIALNTKVRFRFEISSNEQLTQALEIAQARRQ